MTIEQQIKHLEKCINKKLTVMQTQFDSWRYEIRNELTPLRDYVIGQQAIQQQFIKNQKPNVSQEAWNVIKWLVLIIGAILGVQML